MKSLRSFEQILREDQPQALYAVAPCPTWEHYNADSCPTPIVEWIARHYPDVVIERIGGFERRFAYSLDADEPEEGLYYASQLPTPIFRIGFAPDQAEHFDRAWNSPPLKNPPGAAETFYFIDCYPLGKPPQSAVAVGECASASAPPEYSAGAVHP